MSILHQLAITKEIDRYIFGIYFSLIRLRKITILLSSSSPFVYCEVFFLSKKKQKPAGFGEGERKRKKERKKETAGDNFFTPAAKADQPS